MNVARCIILHAPERATQVACGDTCIHSLKAGKGNATGTTNGIVFCGVLQHVDLGFTNNSVEGSQPLVKRVKNLYP